MIDYGYKFPGDVDDAKKLIDSFRDDDQAKWNEIALSNTSLSSSFLCIALELTYLQAPNENDQIQWLSSLLRDLEGIKSKKTREHEH